ncbi:MAG: T9SS type A sorting domain-containing protein [Candidatus Eisenbacteria bacterium]|nr:T9SS type A sorting domain-containing protein [Candidatus Eisenbacteria bacterium]
MSGNTVYVAGAFDTIAGQPRTVLAAIDATTGAATSWNPGVDAGLYPPVWDMVVRGGIVYVGGLFSGLGGQPRYCIGAIDSITGGATSWYPQVDDMVETMAMQGDTLYLGGWFSQVAGVPRNYLAAVDTDGTLLDWDPTPNSIVQTLTVAEGRVFIGGGFTSVGGLPRSELAAIDCATGLVADWIADANPQVRCLAVANQVLYAGGWFTQVGGEARNGLAAIDTQTGAVLAWDPRPNSVVSALYVSGDVLYVGGAFDYLGLELRPGIAAVSLARGPDPGPFPLPGRLLAINQNAPNPVRVATTIRFGLSAPARVTLSIFDLAGRCIATPLKEDEQTAGSHQIELSATGWPSGVYYYRLEAAGATAVRKMVVVK